VLYPAELRAQRGYCSTIRFHSPFAEKFQNHLPAHKQKKTLGITQGLFCQMVGTAGLEPATSWSRTKRTTNCAMSRLREIFLAVDNIALYLKKSKRDIWFVSPRSPKAPSSAKSLMLVSLSFVRSLRSSLLMKAPFLRASTTDSPA
jgi:hypothetical protein